MSKKASIGGIIMILLFVSGLFGQISLNGELVEDKIISLLVAIILFPIMILVLGFIFGFLKDSLIAFFNELKIKILGDSRRKR